ncbi:branched-chain amino acid ABC transporter permease [Cellulomonas soli]
MRALVTTAALIATVCTWLVLQAPAAHAATTPPCTTDATTGCINGTLRTAAGDPAVGVRLEVTGAGSTTEAISGTDGRWSAAVSSAGEYTVTLDVATLPAGEQLRDPTANPRTVAVTLGASSGALFPLGAPAASVATPAPDASAGATGSPAPGTADQTDAPGTSRSWTRVWQQATNGLVFGVLLALASVGLSLIYGTTGLSNFAHGEQVTLGGILAYIGCQTLGLPLLVSGVLAVLVGAASGWFQDAGLWHRLRKRRVGATQQMIVTIGLSMALQYTYQFFFGAGALRIVTANPVTVTLGSVRISQTSLWSLLIAVVVLAAVSYFLLGTRVGRATRAVSDNPALAAASGISVEGIIRLVWTLGAGLAALGGVLMGLYLNATGWNMGGALLLLMFAAVTLGGLGQAFGALAGSIVIGLVVEMSNLVIPSDMRYAGALLILILVLLFRPQGILGRAERIG